MAKIEHFVINTGVGRSDDWKRLGLTNEECKTLDDIGYGTNKEYGRSEVGFQNYLNSLNENVEYEVTKTKYDSGDFSERFLVIQVKI